MTYFIPEGNVREFEKRIARLIKRANKLGSKLEYTIHRDDFRDVKVTYIEQCKEKSQWVRHYRVEVDGDRPKFAGWKFIGTLEHTVEGNVMRMVPGETAPDQYRNCAPFCEHCKLKRLRKDTFLVRHETGTTTQVGSNCLVDFLGHENPHHLAQLAQIWVNLNELTALAEDAKWIGGGGGYITKDRQDLLQFLSHVAEIVIRENQFWSRSAVERIREKRGEFARVPEVTAWRAARYMHPSTKEDRIEALGFEPSEAALKLAEEARDWVLTEYGTPLPDMGSVDEIKAALLNVPGRELNEFEHNLLVVAKGEFCERRTFGIAAYIIEAYRKAHNMVPERKKAPARNSQHFGTVGVRIAKLEVLVEKVFTWNSEQFGAGSLFKMVTPEGNVAVWRTYNVSDENDMVEGKRYVLAATPKAHGEYNGEKQTEMSRVKVTLGLLDQVAVEAQPENLEPGDDFVPTTLQLAAA